MTDTDSAATPASSGPAEPPGHVTVNGFPLALDRMYEPDTHMWIRLTGPGRARIGLDRLGIETSGTLAQLSFAPAGTPVARGRSFGQLEAAKFVGPLVSPLSGTVLEANDAVAEDPGLAERDPYGAGWLIDMVPDDLPGELPALLSDPGDIKRWFAGKADDYRLKGVIAQ